MNAPFIDIVLFFITLVFNKSHEQTWSAIFHKSSTNLECSNNRLLHKSSNKACYVSISFPLCQLPDVVGDGNDNPLSPVYTRSRAWTIEYQENICHLQLLILKLCCPKLSCVPHVQPLMNFNLFKYPCEAHFALCVLSYSHVSILNVDI